MRATVLFVALLLANAQLASAADWPQFRGPAGDGVASETALADSWPEQGPPVLWSRELGVGYSGFAIADGRAYTQGQSLYHQYLECLDAATGKTLWTHRYGLPFDGGSYPGPRGTPLVHDGRVYFAAPNGFVGCVDAKTGTAIWSTNPKAAFGGKGTDFGVSASPVIIEGKLIVPVGGPTASLAALDLKDGAVVWKCGERPASYATPLAIAFEGRTLIVTPLENTILLTEAASGRKLFELKLSHGYDEHSAAPVYREPFLFLSAPFRSGGTCYRIIAEDDGGCRLEEVWYSREMSNDIASSVLVGDVVYGFDLKEPQARLNRPSRGDFRALDWSTGKTRWSSAAAGHANIVAADGKLILFNDRGELLLLKQSAEKYEELARTVVFQEEICWTAPSLANGCVFVRTPTRAACLDLRRERPTPVMQTVADIPQPRRFNPNLLLGGEREFPATPPDGMELRGWFLWCLLGQISALVVAAVTRSRRRPAVREATFFAFAFLFGVFGGVFLNRFQAEYVFTLPLALWVLGQSAAEIAVWAQRAKTRSAGWIARGGILVFSLGCGAYFHLCRRSGLSSEWSFLIGFLPAFPVMVAAAFVSARGTWLAALARLVSFAAYFAACAAYILFYLTLA